MNVPDILSNYRQVNFSSIHLGGLPKLNLSFTLQGIANGYTGYGQHALHVARSFQQWGYSLHFRPLGPVEASLPVPVVEHALRPLLAIQPISHRPDERVEFWFTMHESTRLPGPLLDNLTMAEQLIVPSVWNASCFSAQGVTSPIHICPLGVDIDLFKPKLVSSELCVFGVAGNPSFSITERKNIGLAVKAFELAFPREKDVRLSVKMMPGDVCPSTDERVAVNAEIWPNHQLAGWMQGLTAFVLPSRSEAWGFFALEAMACGVPVVAAAFGGVTDYMNHGNGYLVEYRLANADAPFYGGVGLWADPKLDSMVDHLRYIYANRAHAAGLGVSARLSAERFTWDSANEKLEKVLLTNGFFSPRSKRGSRLRRDRDIILEFYRKAKRLRKQPLHDFTGHTLTNSPTGLGDTVLLTSIPWVAHAQGKERFIHHDSPHFKTLMQFNPYYRPLRPEVPQISAVELQFNFDMGAGHFIQRLQRAMGLCPERKPKGYLNIEHRPVKNRFVFHFEPGRHVQWQTQYVHPKARQIYPETQAALQQFVFEHRDFEFFEVGKPTATLEGVELLQLPLDKTIEFLATCDYFVGIISGPMHVATALGVRCVVISNFPSAEKIVLPTLVDIDQVESEWFYPQNVLLHQEGEGPQVKRFSGLNLERAIGGEIYPYWSDSYLDLIYEQNI